MRLYLSFLPSYFELCAFLDRFPDLSVPGVHTYHSYSKGHKLCESLVVPFVKILAAHQLHSWELYVILPQIFQIWNSFFSIKLYIYRHRKLNPVIILYLSITWYAVTFRYNFSVFFKLWQFLTDVLFVDIMKGCWVNSINTFSKCYLVYTIFQCVILWGCFVAKLLGKYLVANKLKNVVLSSVVTQLDI